MIVDIPERYYNGDKILSKKDLDGIEPSMYLCVGNRSGGKTTFYLIKCLSDFREKGEQFVLLYRMRYETSGATEVFDDILEQYPVLGKEISDKPIADGLIRELYIDGEKCAYALSINNPDVLKKYSPMFGKVTQGIFDEMILEHGKYLSREIEKFIATAVSIGRGGGSQSRTIRWYLLGNNVTLMNPWFISLGIHKRLQSNTRFLRGRGWVLEISVNESAKEELRKNDISRIFEGNKQISYMEGDTWLLDASTFIENPKGRNRYLFTIYYGNKTYGVREFYNLGIIHIGKKADPSSHFNMSFIPDNHTQNVIMLNKSTFIFHSIRNAYFNSALRFEDLETKEMIIDLLGIDLYKT